MYQKTANIQLGGGYKGISANIYAQNRAKAIYANGLQKQNNEKTNVVSKEVIVSTHKISGKVSPTKQKMYSHQTSRNGSVLENENSFMELQNSSISTPVNINMKKIQSPLRDASNLSPSNSQSRQFVRVNFVSNSPNCSRTSSSHLREFRQSPSKMVTCIASGVEPRDEALERKLKVLQGRIGELHREKHELVGKLNEENRKIYHENTILKQKVNEFAKKLEKPNANTNNSQSRMEISALKEQKKRVEQELATFTQNNQSLTEQCKLLSQQLRECHEKMNLFQQENKNMNEILHHKESEYIALHSSYLEISEQKLELLSIKEKYEQDLHEIRESISQNNRNNTMIIEEYECKLEEYKQAYDRNQEIIEQLTLQLQMVPHQENSQDIYPSSDEIMMGESEGELALECKNLENNFLMALDEKDQLIESLELQNAEIKNELVNKDQLLDELSLNNEEQASKLEEVGSILERYTQKIKEMQGRYEELRQKHEQEKLRTKQNSTSNEKCRKCEELTKTIFRLNSHLNKKN